MGVQEQEQEGGADAALPPVAPLTHDEKERMVFVHRTDLVAIAENLEQQVGDATKRVGVARRALGRTQYEINRATGEIRSLQESRIPKLHRLLEVVDSIARIARLGEREPAPSFGEHEPAVRARLLGTEKHDLIFGKGLRQSKIEGSSGLEQETVSRFLIGTPGIEVRRKFMRNLMHQIAEKVREADTLREEVSYVTFGKYEREQEDVRPLQGRDEIIRTLRQMGLNLQLSSWSHDLVVLLFPAEFERRPSFLHARTEYALQLVREFFAGDRRSHVRGELPDSAALDAVAAQTREQLMMAVEEARQGIQNQLLDVQARVETTKDRLRTAAQSVGGYEVEEGSAVKAEELVRLETVEGLQSLREKVTRRREQDEARRREQGAQPAPAGLPEPYKDPIPQFEHQLLEQLLRRLSNAPERGVPFQALRTVTQILTEDKRRREEEDVQRREERDQ